MSGPIANLAAEFAALTGRMQHVLASLPDHGGDYAELAAVCARHGIKERGDGSVDLDGHEVQIGLGESLDLALTSSTKKVRRHDELQVALDVAERAARDNAGEVDRARRDGKAVLGVIGAAKGKLDAAGFNTDAMGWLAGLDDALAELQAWRTGRRRALSGVPGGWVDGHPTPPRGPNSTTINLGGAGGQYPGAPGQPGMSIGGGVGGAGGAGGAGRHGAAGFVNTSFGGGSAGRPDDGDDGCAGVLVPA